MNNINTLYHTDFTDGVKESKFLLNCTNFTYGQLNALNLSRGLSGSICAAIATLTLFLLFCHNLYKTALQRTFIFLTTTTLILEILFAMQIERQFQYDGQNEFCSALGFLIHLVGGIYYMFALRITLLLVYIVYKQLRGDPFPILSNSRCASRFLEILFLFIAILIPSTHHWVPFLHGKFGLAGAYCWIRETDDNCKNLGDTEQLAFYGIAEAIGLTSVVAVVGLSVVYCRIAYKYKSARRQQLTLIRQTLLLMCFLVVHVVFLSAGLAARFLPATSKTEHLVLWYFNAAGIPVSLLVIPTGFLIHVYSSGLCARCYKALHCCNRLKRRKNTKTD